MRRYLRCAILLVGLGLTAAAPARVIDAASSRAAAAPQESGAHVPLVVSIPHHLAKAEAERRVKNALAGLQKDYGFLLSIDHEVWSGPHLRFRATVMGEAATGRIDVGTARVEVKVMMPSNLSILVDMAQPVLLKQGTQLLAKQ